MALTEKVRRLMEQKGFHDLFDEHEDVWRELCRESRELIAPHIENGNPTVDDIKLILMPLIDFHATFRGFMQNHPRLKEKYWLLHFTDYTLHRVYAPTLNIGGERHE